ncbi:hypothetical protein [uncultured Fibrobacter sp.]|uniref:hypothetical protein n=1 Tax=uncultured Fibrobacter sp. TaxID=261512 RepID=UPI0025F7CCE9|nr:hypothetical protein [uncultured Fibrobacter sp.]
MVLSASSLVLFKRLVLPRLVKSPYKTEMMAEALKIIKESGDKCLVEGSGNMTLERAKEIATLGLDYISVGALTHSVKALDISMRI